MIGDTMQLEPIAKLRFEDIENLRKKRSIHISSETCRFFSSNIEGFRSSHHIAVEACKNVLELKEHFRCQEKIIRVSMDLCGYELNIMTKKDNVVNKNWQELHYLEVEGNEKRFGSSWVNDQEVNKLLALVQMLCKFGVQHGEIAILTPFRGQLNRINLALRKAKLPYVSSQVGKESADAISTGTVHRFQGGERRFVLFSHVISRGEPRFLNSRVNLLNVAVSRAQLHFFYVGSLNSLSKGSYTALLKDHLLKFGEPVRL